MAEYGEAEYQKWLAENKDRLDRQLEEARRNAPPRLEIPDRLTLEFIAGVPDDRLDELILEFVEAKWPADAGNDYSWLASLPDGLVLIWATFVVEGELGNGGFNQFFFNGTDALASPAIAGFAAIGAPEWAGIIAEAMARADKDGQRIVGSWGDASLESFMSSYRQGIFQDLDARLVALYEVKDPAPLRIKWIRANTEALIGD